MPIGKNMAKVQDPVCGMWVDPAKAAAKETYEGQTYYFCSESCRDRFLRDPMRYAAA